MCIPPFIPYMLLGTASGYFIIVAVFYSYHWMHLGAALVAGIVQSRIRCPQCGHPILKNEEGWYRFTVRSECRHCGFDTMRCFKAEDKV